MSFPTVREAASHPGRGGSDAVLVIADTAMPKKDKHPVRMARYCARSASWVCPDWRYPEAFIGSRWIWTISLVFDNTVLLRKTVQ
jgi:hypothetical protein